VQVTSLRTNSAIALTTLGIGAFAIGTDSHVVIGLLDRISSSLNVSDSEAGQLVTVFAVGYAVFAPICGWLFGKFDRKLSIQIASFVFISGNLVCYWAVTYQVMVIGRILSAFGAGMYTPLAFTIATSLVSSKRRGAALSVVFGGMTLATAFGVPLGTYIGEIRDWHLVFVLVAALGAVNFVMLAALLRPLDSPAPATLAERLAPIRNMAVLVTLFTTFIAVLSEFTLYSYISLVFADVGVAGEAVLPAVLLAFGIGAIIGNVVSGFSTDRLGPRRILLGAVTVQTILLPTIVLVRDMPAAAIAVAFAWGIVSYMYLIPIQHKLMELSKQSGQMTLSLNSSAIYLGIAGGGALGGLALAAFGVGSLAIVAAVLGVVTLVIIWASF
jgi:predicted MFS family arabinose efflux permease